MLAHNAELREAVARFYAQLDPPRSLEHHEQQVGTYFTLNPMRQPTFRINIDDTGEGMAQVFPVLAQAAVTAAKGGILAVEEPESHLHPNAQRALARHFCELARASTASRFVLETHSRVFLLAVQLEVARGFPAKDVAVLWVGQDAEGRSDVTTIPLRSTGRLGDGWPQAALLDDMRLAKELMRTGSGELETA